MTKLFIIICNICTLLCFSLFILAVYLKFVIEKKLVYSELRKVAFTYVSNFILTSPFPESWYQCHYSLIIVKLTVRSEKYVSLIYSWLELRFPVFNM